MFAPLPIGSPQILVFIVTFLFAAVMVGSRLRASREAKSGKRAPLSILGIALQGLAIATIGFGRVALDLSPIDWRSIVSTLAVFALNGGSVWLFSASARALGANWSLVARMRNDHGLVTEGPFAHVRHPIYAAMLLSLLGFSVATGHEAQLMIALPLFMIGTWIRIRMEEDLLRAHFGTAYDDYARRVPAILPRP